ncbi:hypothetical protein RVR_8180 [Actinacidiphila reveromycinica]|uniref:DUF1275 domain-containing protein n=1 Tax=Actinacidiphila reveromycinica TaxID=659352 RepID=A0A7U3UYB0_9ACTN|nr:YoaK family protein [Streptomyces sp. SN-593]BBB00965.1 hypothetical protein RVR_8180 [Streptomyces sp. SN-593]
MHSSKVSEPSGPTSRGGAGSETGATTGTGSASGATTSSSTGTGTGKIPLVGLLAFASGCVDVVSLIALGGAFTSVVTGNLIFVGRAIGTGTATPAVHAVLAVAGYVLGVAAGSRLGHGFAHWGPSGEWPGRATVVLAAECAVLAAVNAAWFAYHGRPPARATDVLLVGAALALGAQGAALRSVAGTPSTTFMTGALTTLVEALFTGRRRHVDPAAVVGLPALVGGAVCGAVLAEHVRGLALLPPLLAVLAVVVFRLRRHPAELREAHGTSGS